jgi:hypothetical protein
MKKIFTFLLSLLLLSVGKSFSQADSCVVLGCAANYGTQTTNNSLPFLTGGYPGTCYSGGVYKQVFWQFLYVDPAGGVTQDYAQTFTPGPAATPLDIDWVVYLIGRNPPPSVHCPVDHSTWLEQRCSGVGGFGNPTGPGVDLPVLTLVGGQYYAIGIIINPTGADPSPGTDFTFDVGTPTLNGLPLGVTNCPAIILPVRLTSFNAKVSSCTVNLDWTAATETDFNNYEVQSSTDGSTFKTIATQTAIGTNQKYSYQDHSPAQGNIYYRLKMVNIDGSFQYSNIIAMKLNCNRSEIVVYPNPVTDILNINITNAQDNETQANLFDNSGRLLQSKKLISGTNTIDMTKFAKGIFLLSLKNNNEVQNIKIVR